ncbi:hypothetical protein CMALT394_200088 [Carnobacterium maltaromaticum]|nr:hypothetical protein CMALT394_200088 [Carnobacterium maltaromaticum]
MSKKWARWIIGNNTETKAVKKQKSMKSIFTNADFMLFYFGIGLIFVPAS